MRMRPILAIVLKKIWLDIIKPEITVSPSTVTAA
jgi:hypothetical protein